MSERYPRGLSHVGLTVEDIESATEWYERVLGFTRLFGPERVERGEGHFGRLLSDGDGTFEWLKLAHLVSGNQVGLELLEFDRTGTAPDATPTAPGFGHLCVVDPDVEGLAREIEANGGEQIKDIWSVYADREYTMTYCLDPFGNRIEIHSHSYERTHANIDGYE